MCQSKHYPALFGTFLRGRADDDIGASRRGVYGVNHTYICLFPASIEKRAAHRDIYYLLGHTQGHSGGGAPAQVSERPQAGSNWVFFSLNIHLTLQYKNVHNNK